VNADHTVFEFTHSPTVLTLDTGGLVAFLGETGLVNGPHTVLVRMTAGNVLLEAISRRNLIPAEQAQELLQVSGWLTERIGHWLDAFSGQAAQLTFNIEVEIATGGDPAEAVIKLVQESCQFRFDSHNCFGIHVDNLLKNYPLQEYHRLVP
jgi:hypothetical protein